MGFFKWLKARRKRQFDKLVEAVAARMDAVWWRRIAVVTGPGTGLFCRRPGDEGSNIIEGDGDQSAPALHPEWLDNGEGGGKPTDRRYAPWTYKGGGKPFDLPIYDDPIVKAGIVPAPPVKARRCRDCSCAEIPPDPAAGHLLCCADAPPTKIGPNNTCPSWAAESSPPMPKPIDTSGMTTLATYDAKTGNLTTLATYDVKTGNLDIPDEAAFDQATEHALGPDEEDVD